MNQPLRTNPPGRPKSGVWEPSPRDMDIYAMVCSGKTNKQVARRHGVSTTLVFNVVKRVDKWLAPQFMGQIREIKCQHTTRLMFIYQEAMDAWRRSKRAAVTETEKNACQFSGTDVQTKYQVGNPAYLQQAREALEEIREIWGANAPLQIEHSGEVRVAGRNVAECQSELLDRMEKMRAMITEPQPN